MGGRELPQGQSMHWNESVNSKISTAILGQPSYKGTYLTKQLQKLLFFFFFNQSNVKNVNATLTCKAAFLLDGKAQILADLGEF